MSSSKVFRKDSHFTPTTLVRRSIAAIPGAARTATANLVAPTFSMEQAQETEQPELTGAIETQLPPASSEIQPSIDLETLRQEAYNQGRDDLAAQCQHEIHQAVTALAEACQKLDNQRRMLLRHSQSELINLIMLLCEKIVRQELSTPRNLIAATLQSALEQAVSCEEYQVTVHPSDLAVAEQQAPELIAAIRGLERVTFKTDDTLSRGGCLLESVACSVDATIETQLASLQEFVTDHALLPPLPPEPEASLNGPPLEEPPAEE